MALYRYNARDRENRKYKGVKEAGSEAELVKALLEDDQWNPGSYFRENVQLL